MTQPKAEKIANKQRTGGRKKMQIDLSHSSEFERLLNRLAGDIVDAAIFNRLHMDIHASANEFRQELDQSPAFWSLTLRAYLEVVLVRLIRAYDTHDKALSLQSWLQTIKDNLHFFSAEHGVDSPDVVLRGAQPPDSDQLNQR